MNTVLNKLYFGSKMKHTNFCSHAYFLIVNRDCRNYDKFKCETLIFATSKHEKKIQFKI